MGIASLPTEHLNIESGLFNVLEAILFIYLFKGDFLHLIKPLCKCKYMKDLFLWGEKKKKKASTLVNYFSIFFPSETLV